MAGKIDPTADLPADPIAPPTPAYKRTEAGLTPEYKRILDLLDRNIKGWMPEDGDELMGVVSGITTATSTYGEYPLYEIDTYDGVTVAVHAFHTILRNELEKRNPKIGDQVGIRYLGRDADNNDMARYRVVVVPKTETPL